MAGPPHDDDGGDVGDVGDVVGRAGPRAAPAAGRPALDPAVAGTAAERLRGAGQRVTPARVAVLAVLAGRPGSLPSHRSADEIAADVERVAPRVHRATVYRTLETLSALGMVRHVHMGHGSTTYHLSPGDPGDPGGLPHLHARCQRCERVVDLPAHLLDDASRTLEASLGFRLDATHVALSGLCGDCAASRDRGPGAGGVDPGGRPSRP